MLQAAIATAKAWQSGERLRATGFAALALLGLLIATFGTAVES